MSHTGSYADWSHQASNASIGPGLYEAMHGRHIRVQIIQYNADLNYNLGRDRAETIGDKEIPDNKKMGKVLTSGSGDPFDHLHLRENEPAFYYNDQKYAMASDTYVENKVRVHQNHNGMEIPHNVNTDDELDDMFTYAGLPLQPCFVNRSGECPNGVAMAVAGSLDVWNYGHDIWMPGDKITARQPHVNRQEREEERATLPFDREHHPDRDRAILEVLNFAKSHHYLIRRFTESFELQPTSLTARKWSWQRLIPGAEDAVTDRDAGVIALRTFVQSAALNTIISLRLFGILPEPGRPAPTIARSLNAADYNSDPQRELESKILTDQLEDARVVRDKTAFGEEVFYWAAKLGLLGISAPDHASNPWNNLIDSVVGLTMHPFINAPGLQEFFSYSRFFTEEQLDQSRTSGRIGASTDLVRSWNMRDKCGALLYGQRSFAKDMFFTVAKSMERQLGRCVFTAMEMTAPGHQGLTWN